MTLAQGQPLGADQHFGSVFSDAMDPGRSELIGLCRSLAVSAPPGSSGNAFGVAA